MTFWKRSTEDPPAADARPGERPPGVVAERVQVRRMLEECCDQATAATIIFTAADIVCRGTFASVRDDAVVIELPGDFVGTNEMRSLIPLTPCLVTFFARGRSRVFMTNVLSSIEEIASGWPEIIVRVPQLVAGSDSRMAFRVPVAQDSGLRVRIVTSDDRAFAAHPIDLSLSGILIEFSEGKDPDLSISDKLRIELELDAASASLSGVVRRRAGLRYGIYFPEALNGVEIEPPVELRSILTEIERRWLSTRAPK